MSREIHPSVSYIENISLDYIVIHDIKENTSREEFIEKIAEKILEKLTARWNSTHYLY